MEGPRTIGLAQNCLVGGLAGQVHVPDEADVTAKRQPADLPASASPIGPAGDLPPETDGENVGPNPEPARDEVMAKLVEEHERADRQDEGDDDEP